MKKGNNKGFSLIEIIIGIGMLAVIIVPILHTFITSAQINRDSRQVMIQTEVAQTIMEGFAGKTFADMKSSVGALMMNGGVSGNNALSTIDNNLFNTAGAYFEYDSSYDTYIKNALISVSKNTVTWTGSPTPIATCNLVSDNSVMVSMNWTFAQGLAELFENHKVSAGPDARMISHWTDSTRAVLFIGYGNIHYEGYQFDAVVSFLPVASSATDKYYTYRILLTLYEYKPEMTQSERFQHLLMTMDGGIMAGL